MPRRLPDPAAIETDRILADLEKRIHQEYKQALKEADAKWRKYMKSFEAADAKEAARLANGEITKQEYQAWRARHLAQGKHWEEMRNVIAQDYHNRNVIAAKLTNGTMADVYAVNANYGAYLVESGGKIDTGFTLYNHDTAEALLKDEWSVSPETGKNSFLPKPSAKKQRALNEAKRVNPDVLWNEQKLQSAMMQGVLSGEPLTDLAKRLASVAVMDEHQAIRNARTLTTNVQNKGRMDSFDRAAGLGVELMDEWNAILDGVTRHSHRHMHGERKPHDSDKPFSNGCRWPGDPAGPAAEVYNCRCRVISWVKGFEGKTVKENPDMGGMSFEEWQNANGPRTVSRKSTAKNPFDNEMETKGYVGLSKSESDEFIETYHNKPLLVKNHMNTMDGAQARRINRALRKGEMPADEKDVKFVEKLDKAVKNNKLPQDMTLFRGANVSEFRMTGVFDGFEHINVPMDNFRDAAGRINYDLWGKAFEKAQEKELQDLLSRGKGLVGSVIEDKGFLQVSASSQRNIFGFSDINIQLHAPKGLNAYISDYKEESEIILQRNTKYEILGAEISEYVAENGNRQRVLQLIARVVT